MEALTIAIVRTIVNVSSMHARSDLGDKIQSIENSDLYANRHNHEQTDGNQYRRVRWCQGCNLILRALSQVIG